MSSGSARSYRRSVVVVLAAFGLSLAPRVSAQESRALAPPPSLVSASSESQAPSRAELDARKLRIAGGAILGLGIALQVGGTALFGAGLGQMCEGCYGNTRAQDELLTGVVFLPVGAVVIIAGSVMLGVGSSREHRLRAVRLQYER